ncbi:MAG: hypothetical protein IPJ90_17980 [Anaerolineaceae bacterium]|nr:hypothetical protein [Anaerolineaceae bacterium]
MGRRRRCLHLWFPLPTSQSIPNPPTPALPSPTPPPTSAPLPTATYDATLDDWTILVYMDADNNLELPGLLDLNEMEAAGSSEQVNVIVQVDRALGESNLDGDWSDTRRYRILPDADRSLLNSEPLQSLGEQNMGDPQVLADFISWGIQSFPANRYALILWDHGAGWNGIAYDGDAPTFDNGDHISLPDLQGALQMGLAEAGLPALDVIGFDACLMGQMDVFQAVRPFTRYAVGSEELTPARAGITKRCCAPSTPLPPWTAVPWPPPWSTNSSTFIRPYSPTILSPCRPSI